ncbi:radical SAM protein [Limnothrix sp. FACHB-708]|uniref:B12-binding domain-containing radical SAM protein n=1 Tax=unclassified Limnothrix TaxID=2632864 RepID=UPI00168127E4|nr:MULTISPECIES: radical SAM protein [unclassified Limnothrix]MBD2159961.1 radical SAM protein [Limnothrix sp. FACHB-1083]MBD2190661.1 radical SAM protein [Limnothrix sp. FACHB-1088]MBD2553496.1 radical SAM protein [Limnothrix sp. FACHB-708]MBD2590535.1 radical SAM protein [Limnothrix sp. FACHB-406]
MAPFADETLLFEPAEPLPQALPTVFAFPNTYSVGITSLGYQVVWAMLAARPELAVARLFTDAREPLPRSPALVGFSMSWELDYVNVMALLEDLDLPLHAVDRTDEHPIVFGGGPVLTANPEPFAAYFDVVLLGDGEILIDALVNKLLEQRDRPRADRLEALAQVPGLYVPQLYAVEYHDPTGPIAAIRPLSDRIPATVSKQTYRGNALSVSTVVTPRAAWENIFMVETVRSCPELCRFCLASYLTLPFRTADLEGSLLPAIDRGLQATNRIGLLGASVTQHPEFDSLLDRLAGTAYEQVRLSVASVRTNTVTEKLARVLASRDCKSITVAVESGSETVRQIINKKLATEAIEQAAVNAKAGGLSALKLYGMAGIPGETPDDIEATAAMMLRLKKAAPGLKLTLGCSTFVPKAHTPFQWFGVNRDAEKRLKLLQKRLRSNGIDFRPESYNWSIIQTLISRGDRRLTPLLELVRAYGAGDTDNPDRVSLGSYRRAFKELRDRVPPLDHYVFRNWDLGEVLPWEHLHGPLPAATLKKHRAEAVALMPDAAVISP